MPTNPVPPVDATLTALPYRRFAASVRRGAPTGGTVGPDHTLAERLKVGRRKPMVSFRAYLPARAACRPCTAAYAARGGTLMCTNRRKQTAVWCGLCYSNLRRRTNTRGHMGYRDDKRRTTGDSSMGVARARPTNPDGGSTGEYHGGLLREYCPNLHDHLTNETYDDGTARRTSTLLLFAEGGVYKLCLNDRDTDATAWSTGRTAEDALQSMESMIATNSIEWRSRSRQQRRK